MSGIFLGNYVGFCYSFGSFCFFLVGVEGECVGLGVEMMLIKVEEVRFYRVMREGVVMIF